MSDYNFVYLDEQTKRMIRRAILKGLAIPGYQVPFASREMPMPYGWGTGGVQVSAAVMTPDDTFKVIDQGADDTTNAVSIRRFLQKTAGVAVTEATGDASVIQTRHRIPEDPLRADQILVYQVPIPEPLRFLEPSEVETRKMHSLQEYGLMHVKLYEDISQHGAIATAYAYPVKVEGRYVMDPSPIPKFDNPKLEMAAIQLFGAGRAQRIYALPPYTKVVSLDFEDYPFAATKADHACGLRDTVTMSEPEGRMLARTDWAFVHQHARDGLRVNIARGFAYGYPAMLLDEPTASLDPTNRETVLAMITEAKARGAAMIGIFHDGAARDAVCDRLVDVAQFTPQVAALRAALQPDSVAR